MKVLLSAYACLPGRGSEPGIGWNTAREMAAHHEVWAVTRSDNRGAIEGELARHPVPGLHVVYHDVPGWTRDRGAVQLHYHAWQLSLYPAVRALHERERFDLTHHVSYVRWWAPSLLALLPVPFVWGPVGGAETVGRAFRRELSRRARTEEVQREVLNRISRWNPLVRLTAQRSALALANNDETAAVIRALGARHVRVMGESGVDEAALAPPDTAPAENGPIEFASLTRLLHWKGVHLGLEAFARLADPDARYWIVGEGPERDRLQAQAAALGVADRVLFRSGLSRAEWFRVLQTCDALVHPCLANSGNAVSLEAMAAGRPVICLDIGGIREQVTEETGFKIAARTPQEAVDGLVEAMRSVVEDRSGARAMGRRARARVESHFTWEVRGRRLAEAYTEALRNGRVTGVPARRRDSAAPPSSRPAAPAQA